MSQHILPGKTRIEYIDLLKGVSILWVVFIHSFLPNGVENNLSEMWLFVPYRMPLFFFLSGIFFRAKPFKEFLKKKITTLIIPFLGFWLIGLLVLIAKYELIANWVSIDYEGIGSFTEYATSLKGLFYLRPTISASLVNRPLWFLLVLFIAQLFHFFCCKFIKKKSIIFFIGITLHMVIRFYLDEQKITGLFYAAKVCDLYIFYLAGHFWGNALMNRIQQKDSLRKLLICCLLALILLPFVRTDYWLIDNTLMFTRTLCFIPVVFIFCQSCCHLKMMNPIKYVGMHSLEVLVTHVILIPLIVSLILKFILRLPFGEPLSHEWLYVLSVFFTCMALEYFVIIRFCNKYLYFLLGKFKQ